MSESTSIPASFANPSGLLKNTRDLTYLVVLIAMIPSALGYFNRVWNSGHYQFAILFIPIAVVMMKSRLAELRNPVGGSRSIVAGLMLATIATMFAANFVATHIWILSLLMLIACFVYDRYGWTGIKAVLPLWLLMLVVVPLPRGIDSLLVNKMQFMASEMASWILDAVGLVHFRSGVVLSTPTEQFMTEEACSGVRSLFSSLGAVGLYCVHKKYPAWRSLFNLAQTFFWVLAGNALRIATVVFVAENYTKALAEGRPHEILGLFIFFFIVLLVISTDRILQVMIDMRMAAQNQESVGEPVLTAKFTPKRTQLHKPIPAGIRWAFAGLAVFSAICGVRLMTSDVNAHVFNPLFASPAFPISAEPDLPTKIGAWELQNFEAVERGDENILANQSYIWAYRNQNIEVYVSVDGPWEFWHDISACYRGIGWTTFVTDKFDLQPNGQQPADGPLNHTRIELSKPTGEMGLVLFTQNDLDGAEVQPNLLGGSVSLELIKLNALQRLRQLVGSDFKFSSGFQENKLPLATIQLFCGNTNGLSDSDLLEIEKFYFTVRRLLLASPRFQPRLQTNQTGDATPPLARR